MKLINSTDELENLINIRVEEELDRYDGIPGINPIDFTFFNDIQHNSNIIDAYETMQNQYVLNDKNRIVFEDAIKKSYFYSIDAFEQSCMDTNIF